MLLKFSEKPINFHHNKSFRNVFEISDQIWINLDENI